MNNRGRSKEIKSMDKAIAKEGIAKREALTKPKVIKSITDTYSICMKPYEATIIFVNKRLSYCNFGEGMNKDNHTVDDWHWLQYLSSKIIELQNGYDVELRIKALADGKKQEEIL